MSSKEEMLKEVKDLETKLSKSKNAVEKAELSDKIRGLNRKIRKLDEKPLVKDYVPTKDVAAIADRNESNNKHREVIKGMVVGNANAVNVGI